jgi:hypothetical protein
MRDLGDDEVKSAAHGKPQSTCLGRARLWTSFDLNWNSASFPKTSCWKSLLKGGPLDSTTPFPRVEFQLSPGSSSSRIPYPLFKRERSTSVSIHHLNLPSEPVHCPAAEVVARRTEVGVYHSYALVHFSTSRYASFVPLDRGCQWAWRSA